MSMQQPPQEEHKSHPFNVKVRKGIPDRCRTGVRLFAGVVFAFGICSLFGIPFGIISDWSHPFRRHRDQTTSGSPQAKRWAGHEDWTPENCENSWTVTTPGWHHANTNITLNSFVLSHLLVAAQDTSGYVTFTVNPENVDHILVNVDAVYYAPEDLSVVQVCKIGKMDGSEGIGFSISETWPRSLSTVILAVKVYLPRKSLYEFETDLPSWSQTFEDIRDEVSFEHLKLKGSIFEISSKGISARRAYVKTTDGAIAGRFQTYEEFRLETGNGRITADVEMLYNPSSSNNRSGVYAKTQTGVISATTRLLHATYARERDSGSTGGTYEIFASSLTGEINLAVLESPLLSRLTLHSQTRNSSNRVVLHPSYEGSFAVKLDPIGGEFRMHKYGPPDDPTRNGRGRTVSISKDIHGVVEGNAYWSSENWDKGIVVINTGKSLIDLSI